MKHAATLIAASLAWTACSMAGPPAQPPAIVPGQAFSLQPGQSAQTADAALQVGFVGVGADSRCPKGEQCVWAGEAVLGIWLQTAGGTRQPRELRSTPGAAQATRIGELELRLLRTEPYPVSGRVIAPGDYTATFMLRRAAEAASER